MSDPDRLLQGANPKSLVEPRIGTEKRSSRQETYWLGASVDAKIAESRIEKIVTARSKMSSPFDT
jgi:hypothetical protein